MKFRNFKEGKNGLEVQKPKIEEVPDFHGKPNPFVKKAPERKVKGGEGEGLSNKPKVAQVADYQGKPNPEAKAPSKTRKNVKQNQVVEVSNFKEYLDAKGSLKKPTVTLNFTNFPKADGPQPEKFKVSGGKAAPYVGKAMTPGKKALGDMGSTDAYIPKTDPKKDGKELETLKKVEKGQPQVENKKVKDMSLVEVTRYLAEQNRLVKEELGDDEGIPTVTAWSTGKIMPDPTETIEYIAHLASVNANLMEMLVRTLKKKQGGMSGLVGKLLDQPESYKELVGKLEDEEHGPRHAGSLCRAMADSYNDYMDKFSSVNESALSPPVGFEDEAPMDDEEEESDDDFSDEEEHFDDEDDGLEDIEDDDDTDEFKDDLGDEDAMEPTPDEEMDEPPPEMPKKKPKRKFSHDHIIGAMGGHKHMLDAMKSHCQGCGDNSM